MKRENRASISVSKATRERFTFYLARLIGERCQPLTQDDAMNALLDLADKSEYDTDTEEELRACAKELFELNRQKHKSDE
jgi:hypothetical protein